MYSGEVDFFEEIGDRVCVRPCSLFDFYFNLHIKDSQRLSDEVEDEIYECESLEELENIIYESCSIRNYSWNLSEDTDEYTEFYGIAFSNKPAYIMRVYKA